MSDFRARLRKLFAAAGRNRGSGARGGGKTATLDWGEFHRTEPFSDNWGAERGRPVDRFYIRGFLDRHRKDIRGVVLEVQNPGYARALGGDRVARIEVLDIDADNRQATIVSDLAKGEGIPSDTFDCFILTQTLQYIYDLEGAVRTIHRLLKPGGVLLATLPGITPLPVRDPLTRDCCWSFTATVARRLFETVFSPGELEVLSFGNVLSATSFLWGLAQEDLDVADMERNDPSYPVTIAVRARKAGRAG